MNLIKITFNRFNNSAFLRLTLIGLQPVGYFIVFEGIFYNFCYPENKRNY